MKTLDQVKPICNDLTDDDPVSYHHYSLTQLLHDGYWFCVRCERIVKITDDAKSPARCPHCKKATAIWQTPVDLSSRN